MSYELISEDVSIYKIPVADTKYKADGHAQITIGDLHGNALKLIFVLIKHGVVSNINEEQYLELVNIYKKGGAYLTSEDLQRFCTIIKSFHINHSATLRLLGDELSDRGANDYFTLKIIEKLRNSNMPMEIILSNHASEFITAYETKNKFFPTVMDIHFTESMIQMQVLIARKLIQRSDVVSMIKQSYKPYLKAMSYTLSDDLNHITLFTHAPVDLRAVRALAKRLSVTYEDFSAVALAKTIDKINDIYQNYVDSNSVHTLYDTATMQDGYSQRSFAALYSPLEYMMWNRDLSHLDLPQSYKGYSITFVHGHDNEKSTQENMITLDNHLGKTLELGEGNYTALYSHDIQLKPQYKCASFLQHNAPVTDNNSDESNIKATF